MRFVDKIKDLFTDEEEVEEIKEIEVEKKEEHKLPTFMRNKLEEEKEKELKKERILEANVLSDREIVKTRSNSNFSFPMDLEEEEIFEPRRFSNQNVLAVENKGKEKSLNELYAKKEEAKPKKFKPTPVISPVYGILDKNYTKDEVKIQDENKYEIPRSSKNIDFETVRNKAFGSLTDDIKNNMCENCELYKEVKITKNIDKSLKDNLLEDMIEDKTEKTDKDLSIGEADENYFDFGVEYEVPKKDNETVINADNIEVEINNEITIVDHNDEDKQAEKIEVKEPIIKEEALDDTKEFEKLSKNNDDEINEILNSNEEITEDNANDIFNLLDSMYEDEEDK